MKRLTPADFTEMPWRNGGGVTQEIVKLDAGDGSLLWRISTARVEVNGAYSRFPGLMRHSAVVEGNGVRLTESETGRVITVGPSDIAELSGDSLFHGALIDGGIRHLNLVFDPAQISADMKFVTAGQIALRPDASHALYCVTGSVKPEGGESINPGEVLAGSDDGSVDIDGRAVLISVSLK